MSIWGEEKYGLTHCKLLPCRRTRSFYLIIKKITIMKNGLKTLFMSVILWYAVPAMAQPKPVVINGKITSFEESLPLEGASIQVKNSSNSTGTQADGSFSLAVLPGEKVLVISLQGYEKKEITLTKAREYDIVLKRAASIVSFIYTSPVLSAASKK
jgi:hypothetical protein